MQYNLVVCGGTFDHFHKGHEAFLNYALSLSRKIIVGLTSDEYVTKLKIKNEKLKIIEDFETRRESILSFLKQERALNRGEIERIDDVYIPKIWESLNIEAIIVSKDTVYGAEKINSKRKEQGKYPLKIETVLLVKNENNEHISSSRIRNGEINREGIPYLNPYWLNHNLIITDKLREGLKKPFGTILRNDFVLANEVRPESPTAIRDAGQASMTHPYIITVGDVTTKIFNDLHLGQDISVIDFLVARHKRFSSIKELGFTGKEKIIKVDNPAGYLTQNLFKTVSNLFKQAKNKQMVLKINGEEDLSVLPLILAAPLGAVIFYGQPGKGAVKVEVSERTKEEAYNFTSQFKVV